MRQPPATPRKLRSAGPAWGAVPALAVAGTHGERSPAPARRAPHSQEPHLGPLPSRFFRASFFCFFFLIFNCFLIFKNKIRFVSRQGPLSSFSLWDFSWGSPGAPLSSLSTAFRFPFLLPRPPSCGQRLWAARLHRASAERGPRASPQLAVLLILSPVQLRGWLPGPPLLRRPARPDLPLPSSD